MEAVSLVGADIAVLVIYFLVVLGTGLFAMFRARVNSVQGYFLAGRFMTWIPVGASLFASNIGSEHFIGLGGSGAAKGIAVGAFEFNAAILLQLLGWVFLPVYISSGAFTLPDYMKKRFGGSRIQIYLTVLSLLLYIFTKISVNLYSGSLFITEALGWNIWFSILFTLAMTAVITISGGLAAVLYTDLVQTCVMLFGAVLLTAIGFSKIGGFKGLLDFYGAAISAIDVNATAGAALIMNIRGVASSEASPGLTPTVDSVAASPNTSADLKCALPSRSAFVMLRDVSDPEMPWLGYIFGQTPASIWYWCADQMMVQRVLAAKSLSHAQGATLMAGFIKLFPLFIIVMPGMISRILYPDTLGCGTAEQCYRICGNRYGCSDLAYPKLVMGVMPDGLRGLMLAVMLAALMSDLTSIFNSSSTLFTVDIYACFRRKASNRELMIVGRIFVLVMVALSILWVPVIQTMQGGQLYIYIQSVAGFLSPPIAAVYVTALLSKRTNELGAFTGLIYGFLIGITRMILSFVYSDPVCGEEDTRPWIVAKVHYMYFAMFSFFSTAIVMCLVSLLSPPPSEEQVRGLTFWTRNVSSATTAASSISVTDTDTVVQHEMRLGEEINSNLPEDEKPGEVKVKEMGDQLTEDEERIAKNDLPLKKLIVNESENKSDGLGDMDERDEEVMTKVGSNSCNQCLHISGHFCKWFWGFADDPRPEDVQWCCSCIRKRAPSTQPGVGDSEPLQFVPVSLKQKRSTKIGLFVGLVMIVTITVFLFCFFSLYFGPITRGPLRITGNTSSPETLNAIEELRRYGMIAK
ncbi:Sodium/myo-inositol cotransporter [Echinococcus granulosus]|uniref:Sodium/myo-inositol cotransporter n=1 Tax=Echinococcus granulosus TaxID=6210 RepID=W6U3C3_ECHGR|nr:Sodium/myo-inositol cotransporter [Echinococcus granulosus]EUB55628.1 Sodium/myo-inositol cotransporter [Echinococcus granulosus]